jgi:hydroxymethylpyrimidine pyrophosphatase-like HAD family hydrolase
MIAFDFDGTVSEYPHEFIAISTMFRTKGIKTAIVTLRHETEITSLLKEIRNEFDYFIFTGGRAKRPFMESKGHNVMIWIDDRPEYIFHDFGAVLSFDEVK